MSKLEDLRIDAPPPRPRRRSYFPWFPVVFFAFIAIAGGWVFRDTLAGISRRDNREGTAGKQAVIEAPTTEPSGPPGSISAAGYLEVIPPGPRVASALVAGRVDQVLAAPGDMVEAGQVVAVMDTSALSRQRAVIASRVELARSKLERLEAGFRGEEIDSARAAVDGAKASYELAMTELGRAQDLYAQGIIAGRELDARAADSRLAQAALDEQLARLDLLSSGTRAEDIRVARAELDSARTELAAVDWEIGQCRVTAPESGVVLAQYVQPGDWLKPGTDNPRSSAVLATFNPRDIQAWVDVNQRDSAALLVGQPVELTTDAYPGRPVAGVVSRIMPSANLQKNTVQVKISIADPPADFRPELSVKVVFLNPDDPAVGNDEEDGNG